MNLAKPKAVARAVALVEPDEVTRACVARALEDAQFDIACRCASAAQVRARLTSGAEFATILVGTDEGFAGSEPEVKHLRESFPDHRIIVLSLRRACRWILEIRSASERARASASLARALEWVVLEQREQAPTAGRLETAGDVEPSDVRLHIKALLRGSKTSFDEPPG